MLKSASHLKGETIDGYEVRIFANLENPKEIDLLLKNGAAASAFSALNISSSPAKHFPLKKSSSQIYKRMAKALKGRPLVIRVFDIGGDKKVDLPSDQSRCQIFQCDWP